MKEYYRIEAINDEIILRPYTCKYLEGALEKVKKLKKVTKKCRFVVTKVTRHNEEILF